LRVSLAEIERRLLEFPGVEDAAATVISVDGARGQVTVALVVAPGLSPEFLRAVLRRWLDPVVVPRRLRLVDSLPREPNGKLTRKRLLDAVAQQKPRVRTRDCVATVEEDPTKARYELYVPRDLYALRGHFRGAPIVPGVLQLELARAKAVDVLSTLEGEHAQVASLMDDVMGINNNPSKQRELYAQIRQDLLIHAQGEEQGLYTEARAHESTRSMAERAVQDHMQVRQLLVTLDSLTVGSPEWMRRFEELKASVDMHVDFEENQFFPAVKDVLGADALRDLDGRFKAQRTRIEERGEQLDPRVTRSI
jgi:3-hydroxymyristoyl/3-hydroxydecanoyl-(acyl carrier protein) dehydratase